MAKFEINVEMRSKKNFKKFKKKNEMGSFLGKCKFLLNLW